MARIMFYHHLATICYYCRRYHKRKHRTRVKRTRKRVMSPIIRPSEICSGPSTSNAGIKYVVLAILSTLATANNTSETISGSSGFQSNRAAPHITSLCTPQVWPKNSSLVYTAFMCTTDMKETALEPVYTDHSRTGHWVFWEWATGQYSTGQWRTGFHDFTCS